MDSNLREKVLSAKQRKDIVTMEKLYKENPHESLIKFEYARLLKLNDNLDESKKLLLQLLNARLGTHARLELGIIEYEQGNVKQARNSFKSLLNEQNRIYALKLLGMLEFSEKNYNSALNYINMSLEESGTYNDKAIVFLSKELNVFFDIDYNKIKYNYSMNQLLNYNETLAIEHTIGRHKNNKSNGTPFNKNLNIYKLFKEVKEHLTEENKIYKLTFNDWYFIRMDNIGVNGENYLFVATSPHSKNIVTMFPVKDKKSIIKYLDIDELQQGKILIKK